MRGAREMRKWTKQTAEEYIRKAKETGLTYWSAVDYLKHHRMMSSIIQTKTKQVNRGGKI